MSKLTPIAIAIIKCQESYLFIERKKPPYEGLWSLVGGKLDIGEHIRAATEREVMEETRAKHLTGYEYRGLVTERLVDNRDRLLAHFLIFVSSCQIESFDEDNREGRLRLFSEQEIKENTDDFLPSDLEMFQVFKRPPSSSSIYEVEMVRSGLDYRLVYFREG